MKKMAIFASGSGTNAENLAEYFKDHPRARISFLISNRKDAFAMERMKRMNIPAYYFKKDDFGNGKVLDFLRNEKIDLIVLAGFLLLLPESIIHAYHGRIINVHPALLPRFGGKGMYGMNVHEAVVKSGATRTGITIHYVNEHFDAGEIIAQFETEVTSSDTPETVAQKIHRLEMKHFPVIVEQVVEQL